MLLQEMFGEDGWGRQKRTVDDSMKDYSFVTTIHRINYL